MYNRETREDLAALAEETLKILKQGYYLSPSGAQVKIDVQLNNAIVQSRLYRPTDFPEVISSVGCQPTGIEVTTETALAATRRLAIADPTSRLLCLNFASAKNPGGGFRGGSQAQEESLARSSGLYPCIAQMQEMHDYNRLFKNPFYSDYTIYSPNVPIFRVDAGQLLEIPYLISFITAPAVNAGVVYKQEPSKVALIRPTMRDRLHKVLWVAQQHQHQELILGAWGCGVFGNDPVMVAELFAEALGEGGSFYGAFARIVFAVFDFSKNQSTLKAFQRYFQR